MLTYLQLPRHAQADGLHRLLLHWGLALTQPFWAAHITYLQLPCHAQAGVDGLHRLLLQVQLD